MIESLGEKVEKNIRYNKENDTYYVHFSFRDISSLKAFPTLEDARAYRDSVNAEKLRVKTQETIEEIRKCDKEDILNSKDIYPYNALEVVGVKDYEINPDIVDNFDKYLTENCTIREETAIRLFYKEGKTLGQIGEHFGLSRERVRQIVCKGMKRMKRFVYKYDDLKKEEEVEKRKTELNNRRQELVQAMRECGLITEDIKVCFGQPTFTVDPMDERERWINSLIIEELDLSVRSYNCLRRADIRKVSDLIKLTEEDLIRIRNMGKKSVKEIKEKLHYNGLCLRGEEI